MTVTYLNFQEALALHQKGMLNQAKSLYKKLLLINKNNSKNINPFIYDLFYTFIRFILFSNLSQKIKI